MISPVFIGLMFLDGLLLWAICATGRAWWAIKLAAIVVVVTFNFLVIHASVTGTGWATNSTLPRNSLFAGCYVVEPNPSEGVKGSVLLWLVPEHKTSSPFGYHSDGSEPRAYRLAYSRKLHKDCIDANKKNQQAQQTGGAPIAVKRQSIHQGQREKPMFYQLPPPVPSSKGTP